MGERAKADEINAPQKRLIARTFMMNGSTWYSSVLDKTKMTWANVEGSSRGRRLKYENYMLIWCDWAAQHAIDSCR
jgi:hypothetical protein